MGRGIGYDGRKHHLSTFLGEGLCTDRQSGTDGKSRCHRNEAVLNGSDEICFSIGSSGNIIRRHSEGDSREDASHGANKTNTVVVTRAGFNSDWVKIEENSTNSDNSKRYM